MEKRRPHYSLENIKTAFATPETLNRTFTSKQGARSLRMDDHGVIAMIQALSSKDFQKSMTSKADNKVWQDVYRPTWNGIDLYVKFTLDSQNHLLLISCKEAKDEDP